MRIVTAVKKNEIDVYRLLSLGFEGIVLNGESRVQTGKFDLTPFIS